MNITTQYFQKIGGKWSKGFRNLRSKYVDAASFLAQKMETEVLINLVKLWLRSLEKWQLQQEMNMIS